MGISVAGLSWTSHPMPISSPLGPLCVPACLGVFGGARPRSLASLRLFVAAASSSQISGIAAVTRLAESDKAGDYRNHAQQCTWKRTLRQGMKVFKARKGYRLIHSLHLQTILVSCSTVCGRCSTPLLVAAVGNILNTAMEGRDRHRMMILTGCPSYSILWRRKTVARHAPTSGGETIKRGMRRWDKLSDTK